MTPSAGPSIYEEHNQAKIAHLKIIRDILSHIVVSTIHHEANVENVENVEMLERLAAWKLPQA
jgi:hypothetical protein